MNKIACYIVLAGLVLQSSGCGPENMKRPARTPEQLVEARTAADEQNETARRELMGRNLARIKAEYDDYTAGKTKEPPVVDLLVISGGGDWGAFGAGFLKGWGTIAPGKMARPQFDAVTGVSTGALIAPFAFLGDDASIEKVVNLYRNPKKTWVQPNGLISLLRGGQSYAKIPGLESDMRDALNMDMVKQIVQAGADGRILAINTTNIDTSEMRVWDIIAEANRAIEANNTDRVQQVLLASAAVPGAFPPRLIDGTLYVDGGITGNILYGGERGVRNDGFLARWHQSYPDTPMPKIRYWVIFNNEIRWPPQVTQPKWSAVIAQSATASTRAATVNSMRQLFLQAQLVKLKYNADMEVRIVAVPDGWVPPKPGTFVKETMNALADMGEKMGADPSSWRTDPP